MRTARSWAWLLVLATGCADEVQHGLTERQANTLETVLVARGLAAEKQLEDAKKGTWRLTVPGGSASEAVRVLAELGLPRREEQADCGGLGGGLVKSPLEEQTCRLRGLERGVEKTLEEASGVLTARVHVVAPAPVRWGQVPPAAKASVLLRVMPGGGRRMRVQDENLRALVAGAVEGLEPETVSLWIDEVESRPVVAARSTSLVRVLVSVLGALVTGLSAALLWMGLRAFRSRRRSPDEVPS